MKTSLFVFMAGKRYKPKYTKAYKNRLKEAQRAVRNYNRAVTLIEKKYGQSYAPPRRSVDELMKNFSTMKELRREISKMNKIPAPSKLETVRIGNLNTSKFAISETERLNKARNKKREARAEKYGDLSGTSGYAAMQERTLQRPKQFHPERMKPQHFKAYKKQLEGELFTELAVGGYKENYINEAYKNFGKNVGDAVRNRLRDIPDDIFYQLSLEQDYRQVFEIMFWYPNDEFSIDDRLGEFNDMLTVAESRL